ncbi:MAG: DUF3788 family protein [Bacteroidales bacterium]|nr:DUF3788 family protein [Bacteroidales bacterium]
MGAQLLKDPEVFPSEEVLEKVLGKTYPVFEAFMNAAESEEFKLNPEWRYYNDGKAWLCKIVFKKKTVVWLSVWSNSFKVAFYFTEKSGEGITELEISDSIKEAYIKHVPIGKLKPVIVEIREKSQLPDIYSLLEYKIGKL